MYYYFSVTNFRLRPVLPPPPCSPSRFPPPIIKISINGILVPITCTIVSVAVKQARLLPRDTLCGATFQELLNRHTLAMHGEGAEGVLEKKKKSPWAIHIYAHVMWWLLTSFPFWTTKGKKSRCIAQYCCVGRDVAQSVSIRPVACAQLYRECHITNLPMSPACKPGDFLIANGAIWEQ